MNVRHSDIKIIYQGHDISVDLKQYLKSFTYTDCASGQADTISLDISDFDGRWLNRWFPEKTDSILATIQAFNWNQLNDNWALPCGKFLVDNISFDGPPTHLKLEAISTPVSGSFNCRKNTKIWEKTTIRSIASQIASDAKVNLFYDAPEISISLLEQSENTDMAFLNDLCNEYNLALKSFNDKLIVFSEELYEKRPPITTITMSEIIKWSGNTSLMGTATSATVKYSYSEDGTEINYTYIIPGKINGRSIESNTKADNLQEAELRAKALLREANKNETTMSLTMPALKNITATSCVNIYGFGTFDGKYFIEKVTHNLGSGYTIDLEVRRIA